MYVCTREIISSFYIIFKCRLYVGLTTPSYCPRVGRFSLVDGALMDRQASKIWSSTPNKIEKSILLVIFTYYCLL